MKFKTDFRALYHLHRTAPMILELACGTNGTLDYAARHFLRQPNTENLCEMRVDENIFRDIDQVFKELCDKLKVYQEFKRPT
jgi:hypothetical protein